MHNPLAILIAVAEIAKNISVVHRVDAIFLVVEIYPAQGLAMPHNQFFAKLAMQMANGRDVINILQGSCIVNLRKRSSPAPNRRCRAGRGFVCCICGCSGR